MRNVRGLGLGFVVCLAASGCLGTEYEKNQQTERLASCRAGATEAEVDDNILITEEYAGSLATSLQITWLPTLFAIDFLALLGQTLVGAATGSPMGWTFEEGKYLYGSESAAIEMVATTTVESGYGPAGTPVANDIFALDSYLEGAVVVVDSETGVATITYDQPGPLVELLGLGATPPNPLTLTAEERQTVLEGLSTIALEPTYHAFAVTPHLEWDMAWASEPTTIGAIAGGDLPLPIDIVSVDASREDLGQTLETVEWEVEQRAGDVGGHTTFNVRGGHFDYRGRVDFNGEPFVIVIAERELDCP